MTKQTIGLGAGPNDGTGDDLRTGGGKINGNFDELYALLGDGSAVSQTSLRAAIGTVGPGEPGLVPAAPGGTADYLRSDGTWAAPGGQGVPPSGTAGQVLAKIDGSDFNIGWTTPAAGGTGIGWGDPVTADILPDATGSRDLGSAGARFAQGHFQQLFVGDHEVVALPAPPGDRIAFYDTSAGQAAWLDLSGLAITGVTLGLTGPGVADALATTSLPVKASPDAADGIVLRDTAAGGALRQVPWSALPTGGGGANAVEIAGGQDISGVTGLLRNNGGTLEGVASTSALNAAFGVSFVTTGYAQTLSNKTLDAPVITAPDTTYGQVTVAADVTLGAVHRSKVLNVVAAAQITVPAGLGAGFACAIDNETTGDVTLRIAAGVTMKGVAGDAGPATDLTIPAGGTVSILPRSGADALTFVGEAA